MKNNAKVSKTTCRKKTRARKPTASERTDKLETRKTYYHPRQSREMSHGRTRHSKEVDRVLFRIVYTHNNRRCQGARYPFTSHPILREEVEAAVTSLKSGKSARVYNIPSELFQAGGMAMINMLLIICHKIWQTGEWPTPWTQSLIITLPKKCNLQLCQKYRSISLTSHPSKVMLRILLNRLKPQAEIIKEEQAELKAGKSTTEQIFNLKKYSERYLQLQQSLYHPCLRGLQEGGRQSMSCSVREAV